ncbi:DJ-1/PfpI family protein [Pseudomonas sp. SCB32]|uniref:DJ-1/PfpI family protein n=1 Tax=Pseudomonas sp. SCB32 TaxID=2653853 RepID=UPI0012655268|nr:DJ-1/PfpI family protein [Pseudomonas sp. SCB32]
MRATLLSLILLFLSTDLPAAEEALPHYQPRPGHERPVIAVIAQNRMTELVDYVVPLGVLRRSGAAEVLALSTDPGTVHLMPALKLQPQATVEAFSKRYPQGADYLIVPAVHDSEDAALLAFIRDQAAKGATVIGICDGVLVLAHAGLLKGRRATGHWYSRNQRLNDFPDVHWQENRRYVIDAKVMSTSGVTAALPASLALVEAIAGTARAAALAQDLGVADWSPRHDSQRFTLGAEGYLTAAGNYLALWRHERFALPLPAGFDEVSLAMHVDAWARTFRTEVLVKAAEPVSSASGLVFLPDAMQGLPRLPLPVGNAVQSLEHTLDDIACRYGQSTRQLVTAQLEYTSPERSVAQARRNCMLNP